MTDDEFIRAQWRQTFGCIAWGLSAVLMGLLGLYLAPSQWGLLPWSFAGWMMYRSWLLL